MLAVAAVAMIAPAGCGDGRPKRVPISGQVLIDGKPLPLGVIRVTPDNARPASAKIGPDGRFTLTTFGSADGAVLGAHPVAVRACEMLSPSELKWHAPKAYADEQTSGLTITVDGPNDSLVIDLSWKGGKPFVERLVNGKWQ